MIDNFIFSMELNQNQYITKTLKLYDDEEASSDNLVYITESSNLQLGSGARVWDAVK
jgi:hypothetical protein